MCVLNSSLSRVKHGNHRPCWWHTSSWGRDRCFLPKPKAKHCVKHFKPNISLKPKTDWSVVIFRNLLPQLCVVHGDAAVLTGQIIFIIHNLILHLIFIFIIYLSFSYFTFACGCSLMSKADQSEKLSWVFVACRLVQNLAFQFSSLKNWNLNWIDPPPQEAELEFEWQEVELKLLQFREISCKPRRNQKHLLSLKYYNVHVKFMVILIYMKYVNVFLLSSFQIWITFLLPVCSPIQFRMELEFEKHSIQFRNFGIILWFSWAPPSCSASLLLCVLSLQEFSGPQLELASGSTEPPVVQQLHHRGGRHLRQLSEQQTAGESPRHPHVSNEKPLLLNNIHYSRTLDQFACTCWVTLSC